MVAFSLGLPSSRGTCKGILRGWISWVNREGGVCVCVAGKLTNYSHYKRTSLQSANVINMGLSATNLKSNINSLRNNIAGFCSKYLLQLGRLEMPSEPSGRFWVKNDGSPEKITPSILPPEARQAPCIPFLRKKKKVPSWCIKDGRARWEDVLRGGYELPKPLTHNHTDSKVSPTSSLTPNRSSGKRNVLKHLLFLSHTYPSKTGMEGRSDGKGKTISATLI